MNEPMNSVSAPSTADAIEATNATDASQPAPADLIEEELLVEEISIDGMCGVY